MKRSSLIFFLLMCFSCAFGQNPIGLTDILNYSRGDYNGGLQNRGIAQDVNGIVYFANSEGLLSYDGVYWKLYPLPNKTMVRSVAIAKDQKIYVGGQNEMGYFTPDKTGDLVFKSLKNLLPAKARSFKDIWDIVADNGQVYFRSLGNIFRFNGKKITVYGAASQWEYLGLCGHQLFAADVAMGLYRFTNGNWKSIFIPGAGYQNLEVTSLLQLNRDSVLITTLKKGLFMLTGNKLSAFKFTGANPFINQRLLCAIVMPDHRIAIGTQLGGLYIIDQKGNVIENLSRKEGLQNNTILSLFLDKANNLWMGLDDGIDFNSYSSAITHIYPEKLNEGTGYSALLFSRKLYIGTSNWLYELPAGDKKDLSNLSGTFKTVENTRGPAWGLFNMDNHLLLAHHEGAFEVKGAQAFAISKHTGYWNFIPYSHQLSGKVLLAGNYNGLEEFDYHNNAFIPGGVIHFNESSRFVIIEKQTAWMSHNYKGIYKIDLHSPAQLTRLYTDHDGLPSMLKNRLFFIKNRMVVATAKGIYEYNASTDSFRPSGWFKNIFGQKDIRYLKEDAEGNIWFIEDKKLGVADFSGTQPQLIYFPELEGKLVSEFENIYPLDAENIFVGAEKGFYHINYLHYKKTQNPVNVVLRMAKATGDADRILNGGYIIDKRLKNQLRELSSTENNLHFEFAAPSFQTQATILYSYHLTGFEKGWSAWSKKTEKDYTNLPAGKYIFQIRAANNLNAISAVATFSFTILPPWYMTWWADVLYSIIFIVFNYFVYLWVKSKFRRQKIKFEAEQKQLSYLHKLELDNSEKEIIALKNEKLESEILGKNSELASVAMHLLQKGELLIKIREELTHLRKADNEMPSEELKRLIRILNQESKMDRDWDQFATYFDNIHSDFLKAIKETHPLLNAHELKLCAYLKMNLSSKEIAQLLNISVRGVEISRYRLRKKLGLQTEMNLHHYFTGI